MILSKLLLTSKNKDLHYFNYSEKHCGYSFFLEAEKTTLLHFDVSVASALIQYFQSCEAFPPYIAWCLLDHLSEFEMDNGNAYVEKHFFDFNINETDSLLVRLFQKTPYRLTYNGSSFSITNEKKEIISKDIPFSDALTHYLFNVNLIDTHTFNTIINDPELRDMQE